jgi:dienelactone hydrolase
MNTRRQFLAAAAGVAALPALGRAADAPPKFQYVASPPPPKTGPHTGSLDPMIQQLKPGPDFPLSYLHRDHADLGVWKTKARAKMLDLLHYEPEKCDPRAEVLSRKDCGDYIREEIRFNTTPVFRVPATMLLPKHAKLPAPAIVALHSHGGYYIWGREREIETEEAHPSLVAMRAQYYGGKAFATELVRRGYVVIAIDMFYWGERRMVLEDDPVEWKDRPPGITAEQIKLFNQRSSASEQLMGRTLFSAGITWAGILAWDDIRTVEYLITRPEVDPKRIGCVGHSVGGLRSTYLAALDERIKAAVVCGWMCSFPSQLARHIRNTIGHTKIIPGLYRHMDHPDIAALAIPTPLMVINGQQDALFEQAGMRAAHEKLAQCYAKAGVSSHFRSIIEDQPHQFNADRQADAWEWFKRWL